MEKKKKILILNPYLSSRGGGEKHMCSFCQFLEKYYKGNVQIDIFVYSREGVDVFAENYVTIKELNHLFGLHLSYTNIKKIKLNHEFINEKAISANNIRRTDRYQSYLEEDRTIRKISKEYDIFVNWMFLSKHTGSAKINLYACMFPPKKYPKTSILHLGRIYRDYIDKRFKRKYHAYICNSYYTDKWLREYWDVKENDFVIYPPVFETAFGGDKYQEVKKENIILSVGRFFTAGHNKRQLELIKFFVEYQEVLKDYEYHLAGNVSDRKEDREYLELVKKEAAKAKNIYIHENCKREELTKLYQKAKIFWHGTGYGIEIEKEPEKMEHFGISTVEAMAYGVVPVVIEKGGQKEIVEQGVNGYLWNKKEECVQHTLKLIKEETKRKEMAKLSAEMADKYSMEHFLEQNKKLFQTLGI